LKKRAVELATADILIGEWVEKGGSSMTFRQEKPYINHYEIHENGIYLNRKNELTYISKANILVIRFAHENEKETIVTNR
jgi:hypothetical protein